MRLTRGIRNGIRRVNLPDNLLRGCVSSRYGYEGGPINVLHILQIGFGDASLGRTGWGLSRWERRFKLWVYSGLD